jgi:serine protease AprX
MKFKITFIILVFSMHFIFSQSPRERKMITEYYNELRSQRIELDTTIYSKYEKKKALEKAVQLGIPTKLFSKGEEIGDLVRFEYGLPVYYGVDNLGAAITTRANLLHPGGSMGLSLAGAGMTVGVWDQNNPRTNHVDFDSRILIFDTNFTSASNHATHVTGTMISSGVSNASGRGIAYQADAWANDWNNDLSEMQSAALQGLLLSNHSYGAIASSLQEWQFGAYTSAANAVDNICFNFPKYLPIFSAGNDRDNFFNLNPSKNGYDLLNGNKTSKNAIIVGAVGNVANYVDPSSVTMSSFSNYGPTDDFRIKPDIVAKGVNVFSTTSTSTTSYGSLSGTSMASPGVTSSLLLVQQHVGFPYLNASTLKGLAIHTADEAGPTGPDPSFGWGLLNVAKMVEVINGFNVNAKIVEGTLQSGTPYFIDVLANQSQKIKATLSWTDRPGPTATANVVDALTPRLVNDLDLRITNSASTFFPWYLNKDWSNPIAMIGDNNVDNVEQVNVSNAQGIYRISVSHKANLTGGNQDFSLVITGIDAQAVLGVSQFSKEPVVWLDKSLQLLHVNSDNLLESVELYDINGRKLYAKKLNELTHEISVSNYSYGVYVVRVMMHDGTVVSKKVNIF